MDPGTAAVFAAGIAAIASIATALIAAQQKRKLDETHRQLTVNHHSSRTPTILDMLNTLDKKIDRHIEWHAHKREK